MQRFDLQRAGAILLNAAMGLTMTAELFFLGVLSYLGIFTRYMADDYCEMLIVRSGPLLSAVIENYMSGRIRAANRFSHLLLVGWSDMLGKYNVQFLPALMILVWLVGLTWSIHEARKLAGIKLPGAVDYFLAVTLVFFSALQAPNRFQTFLWRSSVTTHFAPIVFMFLLSGFVLSQIHSAPGRLPALWVSLLIFVASFFIGGISEPATAVLIVVPVLFLFYTWRWKSGSEMQRPALILLIAILCGAFLALCALFLAPGNLLHGITSLSIFPAAFVEAFQFTFAFVWDTFLVFPLPTLISILIPGLLFFCFYIRPDSQPLLPDQKRRLWTSLILVPLIHYLLIAASFAPSSYGQSYPEERARFLGRFLMTAGLMFEGALLGVWVAQFKRASVSGHFIFPLAGFALLVFGLYPLRSGLVMSTDVERYKSWASAWDARDAYIRESVAAGVKDLAVTQLDSIGDVIEYKGRPTFWVNGCVAQFYGLNSIVAP